MASSELEWSEDTCRAYARYMELNVRHNHRSWARAIARDWPRIPANATVVDVAGGPAFLLLEVAPLLVRPHLVLTDGSAVMVAIGKERAAARSCSIEAHVCHAEKLDLLDASTDLVLCKHFLRLATDVDASLREMARILKPGGRAYLVDFNRDRPWLAAKLLHAWILLTAPAFLRASFGESMATGLAAASLPARVRAAGFAAAEVLHAGVSYLVRAAR